MLDGLVQTVEKLRERIRAHRSSIGSYEVRTRASLIDPMLCALGWDVGDPTHVTLERPTDSGRPDYALLGATGKPVLLIEAKKLEVTREPINQVVAYVVAENMRRAYKVPFCAYTNGDVWEVFDVLNSNSVLNARISSDDAADCAFKLLGLWRASLIDGSLRTAVKLPAKGSAESAEQVDRDLGAVVAKKDEASRSVHRPTPRGGHQSKNRSGATPKLAFRQPLLDALKELGRKATSRDVLEHVEKHMEGQLNEADYGLLRSGQKRWEIVSIGCAIGW